jgi:hypothetical protein
MLVEQQYNGMESEIKIIKGCYLWLLNNGRNSYVIGSTLTGLNETWKYGKGLLLNNSARKQKQG